MSLREMFLLRPYRSLLVLIAVLISVVGNTGGAYTLTYGINELRKGSLPKFVYFMLIFAGLQLLGYLSGIVAQFIYLTIIQKYFHQLRSNYVHKLYYYDHINSVSKMQNRLTNDLQMLSDNRSTPFLNIMIQSLTVLLSVIALFTFHWSLLLLVIVLSVVMISIPSLIAKRLQKVTSEVSHLNQLYLQAISKWLGGLIEMHRYAAKTKLFQMMANSSQKLENSWIHRGGTVSYLNFINLTMNVLSQLFVIALSGFLIIKGDVAFGVIISSGQFAGIIFSGIVQISNSLGVFVSTKDLNNQVQTTMNDVSYDNTNSNHKLTLQHFTKIQTHNLSLTFDSGESIYFPDLKICQGEKVLLTGDSGSGKSTLLKILAGIIKPTTGTVSYFNEENKKTPMTLNDFSYLPQSTTLFPDTIANNITMFDRHLLKAVPQVIEKVAFQDDINKFPNGQDTRLNLDNLTLSGGQQQKIVLARAEIHNKPLLFIDEGTSAIDQNGTFKILNHLLASNRTIIFIAHNFDKELIEMFDQQVILKNEH